MKTYKVIVYVESHILDEMNRILASKTPLKDNDDNNLQTYYAHFDNNFQAVIRVRNGSTDDFSWVLPPWIECVLFDENSNEIYCHVAKNATLDGEYHFSDGLDEYVVIIKRKSIVLVKGRNQ